MTLRSVRWRCFGTATAVVALTAVAGCSSGSSQPTSARPSSTSPVTTSDPAATAALVRAVAATKALRSYGFHATQRLSGTRPQITSLSGRAVRPAAITYDLTVGGKVQQVIKIGGRTYVRLPPAAWKALAKPGTTVDPLASLLPLLNNLKQPALKGHTLTGEVEARVLSNARLAPAGAAPNASTPVTFTLDAAGHVTGVSLRISVRAGAKTLVLDEATSFSLFNVAPAIKAPGTVKK